MRRPDERCASTLALALILGLGSSPTGIAAASGLSDIRPPDAGARPAPAITLRMEAAGDSVEHAPNVGGGRHADPESRPRYLDTGIGVRWYPLPRLDVDASLSRRRLHSLRDAYELDAWSASATLRLTPARTPLVAGLALRVAGNASDSLDKNSWTRIDGATLTDTRLLDARDRTVHADLMLAVPAGRIATLHAMIGGGRVETSHSALAGGGTDARGCEHAFEFDADGGTLEQIGPCGDTLAFSQSYADEAAVDARFGLAPSTDLAWGGSYWRVGGELALSAGRFDASLGVRWRHWLDNDLMRALRERGEGPVTVTRTARLGLGWRATRRVSVLGAATWRSAPLLNEVPVLYNALSVDRYRGTALTFSLGVRVTFGK